MSTPIKVIDKWLHENCKQWVFWKKNVSLADHHGYRKMNLNSNGISTKFENEM